MNAEISHCILALVFALLCSIQSACCLGKIVFAVNAGGDVHTDIYGIKYQKGTSSN